MEDERDERGSAIERYLAYEVGWRMGLDRAKAEIRRLEDGDPPTVEELSSLVRRLDALAASGPLPGRTGSGPPREVRGDRLALGYPATADESPARARLFLAGVAVAPGQEVELLLARGRWVTGTFGWTGRVEDRPTFSLDLGGMLDAGTVDEDVIAGIDTAAIPRVSFVLPEEAVLRWPPRSPADRPPEPPTAR